MSKRSKTNQKRPQGRAGDDPADLEEMLFAPQTATDAHPSKSAWEPAGGAWDARPDLDDLDVYLTEAPAKATAVRDTLAEDLNSGRRNPLGNRAADEMAQTIGAARTPARVARPTEEVRGRRGGVFAVTAVLLGVGAGGFLFARGVDPVLCGVAAGLGLFAAVIVKLVGRG